VPADRKTLDSTLATATERLLSRRDAAGCWRGGLSPSALSTATAVLALSQARSKQHEDLIRRGLHWLLANCNADGGWGDTIRSCSNISTTLLAACALQSAGRSRVDPAAAIGRADEWLARAAGGARPAAVAAAVAARYGKDQTFAAPILAACAISGRLGPAPKAWRHVKPLPFELAALPRRLLGRLGLPVVSYALPALIAVGQVRFFHRPPANPIIRMIRRAARRRTLRLLRELQPPGGGFLEAPPLTSFVAMSLMAAGHRDSAIVRDCLGFLAGAMRTDGSCPIDTDLATWVTTLSVRSLGPDGPLSPADREAILDWLLAQQHLAPHPYTHAAPGGWAWTDLPGAVPDADDTASALLALRRLDPAGRRSGRAAEAAVRWLAGLQNADGGIPTFCRGWARLPFDRSAPDLTAHALLAWAEWMEDLSEPLKSESQRTMQKALAYLRRAQRSDGSYLPLWFGSESAAGQANPTYGTARVAGALAELSRRGFDGCRKMLARAAGWLLAAGGGDGGWGAEATCPPSIEETALAVDALSRAAAATSDKSLLPAVARGASWLIERTDRGRTFEPSPIGLYFARLWYYEELYPIIFTVAALRRARALM